MRTILEYKIEQGEENFQDETKILLFETVLIKIRCLANNCGKYLAAQQLFSIMLSIYYSAASIFISFIVFKDNVGGTTRDGLILLAMVSIFPLICNSKLYFKIHMAVKITEQVKKLFLIYCPTNKLCNLN